MTKSSWSVDCTLSLPNIRSAPEAFCLMFPFQSTVRPGPCTIRLLGKELAPLSARAFSCGALLFRYLARSISGHLGPPSSFLAAFPSTILPFYPRRPPSFTYSFILHQFLRRADLFNDCTSLPKSFLTSVFSAETFQVRLGRRISSLMCMSLFPATADTVMR